MDKKGFIQEHSKIKLELYRLYLERYLAVLLATPFFERIVVSDVFAGCGVSENEQRGSALIAAETIEKIKAERNPRNKAVILNLNDVNQANCLALQQHLQNRPFVHITNQDADQYIQSWEALSESHNLFFIDPHGYTQVSTKNLKRLFTTPNCDFLIFIPINHIYRFLKPSDAPKSMKDSGFLPELGIDEKRRQMDVDKFYEPIAKFLTGLGIEQTAVHSANRVEEFADVIVGALREISGSQSYVYCQMIQNKEHNSKYSLFFISHHVLGAEKFLEAQSELEAKTKEPSHQQDFDFISQPESSSILHFVDYDHDYDNVSLYEQGVKWGIRPTELKSQLKHIEKDDKNRIEIKELPGKTRNKGGLYIDYKHFKESNRIITITFRRQLWHSHQ